MGFMYLGFVIGLGQDRDEHVHEDKAHQQDEDHKQQRRHRRLGLVQIEIPEAQYPTNITTVVFSQ